ncbi:MAG: OmpA family protein [Candidatus Peribacteria bacterium]|jgi:NitT/TauT family transport system substrate-binding protein|nr:OmpA family protein [Candidatus Peribacteria bacterium]
MANSNSTKEPFNFPWFPKSWNLTVGFQVIITLLVAGVIGYGIYFFSSNSDKLGGGNSSSKTDVTILVNNFVGFAPPLSLFDKGMEATKDSRLYKEFGITAKMIEFKTDQEFFAALQSGEGDVMFVTTDIFPIKMEVGGDFTKIGVEEFLKLNDSRGADVFVVDKTINTIADLRGKTVACALGWPGNTLLHKTLEAGGLTASVYGSPGDVNVSDSQDPEEAIKAFKSGNVDAIVVWSPDDIDCIESRKGAKVLTSTETMPHIIMDGLIAKHEIIEKKKDKLVALAKAWLTANAEMSDPQKMKSAAKAFQEAFGSTQDVETLIGMMKTVHFATYGDNKDFFGLSTDFSGTTGQTLYTSMAKVYKNGYGNNFKEILPWPQVSNASIIQAITGLDGEIHQSEKQITFAAIDETSAAKAIAVASKRVSVNFEVNSSLLSQIERNKIRREVGETALNLEGFRIRIEGNTDSTGSRELNIRLSKARADAVKEYLVKEYGFDPHRIITIGNGPDKPIADNGTEAGRAENRNTAFDFIPAK